MEFVCGKINIQDIIACSLSLKKSEYKLFEVLIKIDKPLSIVEISKKLSLDRTTVQKTLKSFSEKRLVQRYQQNLENGGYVYRYIMKDKESIKKHIKTMLAKWTTEANNTIDIW